jgi:hypothetical protein
MVGVGKNSRRRQISGTFRQIFGVVSVKILCLALTENIAVANPATIATEVGFVGTAEFADSVDGPFHTIGLRTASFLLTYAQSPNLRLHALLRPDATLIPEKEACRREYTGILDDPFGRQDCSEILDAYDVQWLSNNQLSVQLGVRDKFWQTPVLPLSFGLRPALPSNSFSGSLAWAFGTQSENNQTRGFAEAAVFSSDRHEQPASAGLNDDAPTTRDSRPGVVVVSQYKSGAFGGRSLIAYDALNAPVEGNLNLVEGEVTYAFGDKVLAADFLYQRLAFKDDLTQESFAANLTGTIPYTATQSVKLFLDWGASEVFQGTDVADLRGRALSIASISELSSGLKLTVQLQGESRELKVAEAWESGFFRDSKPAKEIFRAGIDLTYTDL